MLLDLAQKRYSVRDYQGKKVEKEKLTRVLEAGRLSPTAVNKQPLEYIVVSDQGLKDRIIEAYPREWIKSAPTIIVVTLDHSKAWVRRDGKDHGDIDGGIAIGHMTLAATDLGLGTCIVCHFDNKMVQETFDLPSDIEAIALLPIGYPKDDIVPEKKRNNLDDIVTWKE